uniref:Uncharacterized protein n=1 Tax=Callorhinchus milii TaxID=7868 RepID=A0A4W3ICS4_CALMI
INIMTTILLKLIASVKQTPSAIRRQECASLTINCVFEAESYETFSKISISNHWFLDLQQTLCWDWDDHIGNHQHKYCATIFLETHET